LNQGLIHLELLHFLDFLELYFLLDFHFSSAKL
jgi:hypothetical protein